MSEKIPTPSQCFRCERECLQSDPDTQALLVLWNASSKYSGTFVLPLCYSCSMLPHLAKFQRVLPRQVSSEVKLPKGMRPTR